MELPEFDNHEELFEFVGNLLHEHKDLISESNGGVFFISANQADSLNGIRVCSVTSLTSIPGFCALHYNNVIEPTLQAGQSARDDFHQQIRERLKAIQRKKSSESEGERPSITND